MQLLASQSHPTSTKYLLVSMTLSVSTLFSDFALEELAVSHLTQMGYHLAHRVVGLERWQGSESFDADLIVTDFASISGDRVIVIPPEAIRWNRDAFTDHLHKMFYTNWYRFGHVSEHFLALGSASVRSDTEDIVEGLIGMQLLDGEMRSIETFHEGDLTLAMMPTRRSGEIERIRRIQSATKALFLFKEGRAELARAESFVEYQRRMHHGLKVGFLAIASSDLHLKRFIKEAEVALGPFPVFSIRMNALRALRAHATKNGNKKWNKNGNTQGNMTGNLEGSVKVNLRSYQSPSKLQLRRLRIKELADWLGSARGYQE
jgi:hypothetical protein